MIIDIHVHERTHSLDSFLALDDIVHRSRQMGLDAVCITDHDSMGLADRARRVSRKTGFPLFLGVEVSTHEGDILVFGLKEVPRRRIHAAELLKQVERHGAVAVAAHPYRITARSLGDLVHRLPLLSGIEGLNGNTPTSLNRRARKAAHQLGLPVLGGSDAHYLPRLGKFATRFPDGMRDEQDLVQAIHAGQVAPLHHHQGRYEPVDGMDDGGRPVAV